MARPPGGPERGAAFPGTATDRELARLGYDLVGEHRRAIQLAGLAAGDSVLDVATGSGRMAFALAAAGCRVVSGDVDAVVVRETRERLGAPGAGIEFRVLDAFDLGVPDGSVPWLATANALHHMERPERALAEMARVVGEDGGLLIVEFHEHGFDVMDRVHQALGRTLHERGTISAMAVCEFLRSRFEEVQHHLLPLDNVWVARRRRPGPPRAPGNVHARCFACGPANPRGLQLHFEIDGPTAVVARCVLTDTYEGFHGVVQGGIVSLLLDSAMANCLFRQGVQAMTARLTVRFRHPVRTDVPLVVRADLSPVTPGRRHRTLYTLQAVIEQDGTDKASATGTFVPVVPSGQEP